MGEAKPVNALGTLASCISWGTSREFRNHTERSSNPICVGCSSTDSEEKTMGNLNSKTLKNKHTNKQKKSVLKIYNTPHNQSFDFTDDVLSNLTLCKQSLTWICYLWIVKLVEIKGL